MLSRSNLIKIFINTVIGFIFVIIWLKLVNLNEILKSLQNLKWEFLLISVLFFIIATVFRAVRLKLILKDYKLSLKNLTALIFLGQMLSFLIPIRAGELTKSVYLHTQTNIPLTRSVLWVLIDRFLDFWTNLLLGSILLLFITVSAPPQLVSGIYIILISFSVLFVAILITTERIKKLFEFFSLFLIFKPLKKWFVHFSHSIIEAFGVLKRPPLELAKLFLITLGAVISDSIIWYAILLSLGLNLGFFKNLLATLLLALTFLVPSAPGYVGSAQASSVLVYSGVFGIDVNLASAGSLVGQAVTLLCMLVFGIASLYFLKFDLRLVWKKLRGR